MRFGKTLDQAYKDKIARLTARRTPHRWFAWFPVTAKSGRKIWLEDVARHQTHDRPPEWSYEEIDQ